MKELIIPLSVISVIISLILPLPTGLIDFLLVGNLVLALVLLVSALYVSEPMKLSALPSMLLLATLYRLGLNVSTTRMILSHGEAGQTIEAFGTTVIGGNLVVGVVVFLLITLVQFIVIAKGAERVAEVAARFTLDALPGKQMSIDADVRAGILDSESARRKRDDLQVESRFYGALDGAMKFIKGDAIAGIVIAAINIIGGLTVGMAIEGLEFGNAISRYTTLTIGDGLVSQIPALLNSLAAGMIVTRVHRGDGSSLSQELLGQLTQSKRVALIIAGLTVVMAFVPGMPAVPLCVVAFFLAFAGYVFVPEAPAAAAAPVKNFEPKLPALWQLDLGPQALAVVQTKSQETIAILENIRQQLYNRRGLIIPLPDISQQADESYVFQVGVRGVIVYRHRENQDPEFNLEVLNQVVSNLIDKNCLEFVDDMLTRRTLDALDRVAPELVSAVIPGVVSLTQLTELVRLLVTEGVSVRNFDMILQSIAEVGSKVGNDRVMLEEIRIALRRQISARFQNSEGAIEALVLDPVVDLSLVKSEKDRDAIDAELMLVIAESFIAWQKTSPQPITLLVASRSARRLLRECLKIRSISLPVIAHEEIAEDVRLVPQGFLTLGSESDKIRVVEKLAA